MMLQKVVNRVLRRFCLCFKTVSCPPRPVRGVTPAGEEEKKAGDKKKQVPDKTSKVPVVFSFLPAVFRHSLSERPEVGTAEKE